MQSKDPYSLASLNAVSGNSPVTPVCPAPGKHNPSPPPSEREVRTRECRKFEIKLSHYQPPGNPRFSRSLPGEPQWMSATSGVTDLPSR